MMYKNEENEIKVNDLRKSFPPLKFNLHNSQSLFNSIWVGDNHWKTYYYLAAQMCAALD